MGRLCAHNMQKYTVGTNQSIRLILITYLGLDFGFIRILIKVLGLKKKRQIFVGLQTKDI